MEASKRTDLQTGESQTQHVNYLPGMPKRADPLVRYVARLFRRRGSLRPVPRDRDD